MSTRTVAAIFGTLAILAAATVSTANSFDLRLASVEAWKADRADDFGRVLDKLNEMSGAIADQTEALHELQARFDRQER